MNNKPEKLHWWSKVKCEHNFQRISMYVEICKGCGYMRVVSKPKKGSS
jgi:hypothetical protein